MSDRLGKRMCMCFLILGLSSSKRGGIVEAIPSKVILLMPKNQELSKVSSKDSRIKFQVSSFKIQDSRIKFQESRIIKIKIQDSRFKNQVSRIKNNQDQDSRHKIQESREDLIKISIKKFFKTLSST